MAAPPLGPSRPARCRRPPRPGPSRPSPRSPRLRSWAHSSPLGPVAPGSVRHRHFRRTGLYPIQIRSTVASVDAATTEPDPATAAEARSRRRRYDSPLRAQQAAGRGPGSSPPPPSCSPPRGGPAPACATSPAGPASPSRPSTRTTRRSEPCSTPWSTRPPPATTPRWPWPSDRSSSPWAEVVDRRGSPRPPGSRQIHERTAPFARLVREAATSDPEIATVLDATRERQRADVAAGVELVIGRPPTDHERDGVWAILSPEVFLLLVRESGWSADQYETWVASTLAQVLPRA